jgi:hypothetical protein
VAWTCTAGDRSQQWTGYSDGTLRVNGKCLAVTAASTQVGARVELWACTSGVGQPWASARHQATRPEA